MSDIISGHAMPSDLTPIYRRSVAVDFNTLPLAFTGFESLQTRVGGGGAAEITLRFYGATAVPTGTRRASLQFTAVNSSTFVQAPNQNNWHSTAYTVDADHTLYSVRLFKNDPLDPVVTDPAGNPAANPGPGAWWSLNTFQRDWTMRTPASPGVQNTTAIWQMAKTADLSTILAQATIRLQYTRA